jgi:hypothetical protein
LRRDGLLDLAERLHAGTLDAIGRAGLAKHLDPLIGECGGGGTLSWTAAAYLVLTELDPQRTEAAA